MKSILALLATALGAVAASPAIAQEDVPQTPAEAFSGTRIEATFGWDHLSSKSLKDIDSTATAQGTTDGIAYGGAIGYDTPVGDKLTLGAEFGVYGSSAKWTNPGLVSGTFNTASVRAGRDIFAGVRLGYALTPKTLVFGKAGYANTHFGIDGANGSEDLYEGINANGFRLGAGVEHKLTKATYAKIEYDYSHYGSGQFNYLGSTPDASNFDLHNDRHQVMASVGVRF